MVRSPSRRRLSNLLVLAAAAFGGLLAGCGGTPAAAPRCEGATALLYDPVAGELHAWPDDAFSRDEEASPTGVRLHLVPGENVVFPPEGAPFLPILDDLSRLDGFGTTSPAFLRFSGPLDPASVRLALGAERGSVHLVDLERRELVEATLGLTPEYEEILDGPATLMIEPVMPLRPGARYGIAVTTDVRAPGGGCVAPAPVMERVLAGDSDDPMLRRLHARAATLVEVLAERAGAPPLLAAITFTTQHTVDDSAAVARDVRTRMPRYTADGPCSTQAEYTTCEGHFSAFDYRVDHRFVDETRLAPQAAWELAVTTWLPAHGQAPWPTIVFGHGLGSDRHQAEALARLAAPEGYAVVAIDAVRHGDHPDRPADLGDPRLSGVISFFGLSLTGTILDSLRLRDNWRQSTYDKLQLIELLRPGLDVDGDGVADVGHERLSYLGVSLGGIMAAELLAFAPELRLAVVVVPGARVSYILRDGADFGPLFNLLRGQATDGEVARFFPLVQTAIDRGDPGAYTRHVVTARLPGFDAARPQLLMQMVIGDRIVPNSSNRFYAAGLGAPLLGDELQPIPGLRREARLPAVHNVDGEHTAGVFQYDLVWEEGTPCCDLGNGGTEPASHNNVGANPVTIHQTLEFLRSYFDDGAARIVDPYRDLGLKR